MMFSDALKIKKGITAIIGGGGKTSLMYQLASELKEKGTVIVCTSTKIKPPEHIPCFLTTKEWLNTKANPVVCLGQFNDEGKFLQPLESFSLLMEKADYVLVEADGSKRLPIKSHAGYEPVIPQESNNIIYVIGADAFNQPICEKCHRPELFCEKCECALDDLLTIERISKLLHIEKLGDRLFINKVENRADYELARELSNIVHLPCVIGSLKEGKIL